MIADTSLKTGWHRGKGRLLGSGAAIGMIADTSLKTGWHRGKGRLLGKGARERGGHRDRGGYMMIADTRL